MNHLNKRLLVTLLFASTVMSACTDRKLIMTPANENLDPLPVEPQQIVAATPDPLVAKSWAPGLLGMSAVWADGSGSKRVTVAVLSTGIDYNHEDLRGNILVNKVEATPNAPGVTRPEDGVDDDNNGYVDDIIGYDVVDRDGYPFDRNGAGTAAAGVIGAVHGNGLGLKGVNGNVSLIPVRYIGENGLTHVPNLVNALRYASASGADVIYIHMANIRFNPKVEEAERSALTIELKRLAAKNTPVIVSAGNTGADVGRTKSVLKEMAAYKNVMIVTSIDRASKRPFIANFGMQMVHIAAPGEEILSTQNGTDRYERQSGTYLAAAHVSGAIALALSRHYGRYTTQELFAAMLSEAGSDRVDSLRFETIGGNRLNVSKFLKVLK